MFEYGVILNGSQTHSVTGDDEIKFEYGVILNGSQTSLALNLSKLTFEYGVSDEDMYNAIKNHYFEYKSFFDLIK